MGAAEIMPMDNNEMALRDQNWLATDNTVEEKDQRTPRETFGIG
ncbi:MAG TPA: hypothetical protein VKY85_24815 [Candidatus Angelobacter sp.]|nr:hypothetical protein [Candidatus Angelobacter sp.]